MDEERELRMPAFDERAARRRARADWLRALERTACVTAASMRTLAAVVDEHANERPMNPALIGENGTLTYGELAALSNRYARWANAQGLRRGDRVALVMGNAPSYLAIWIGLSRVGLVTALVNAQLTGASLAHSISVAAPKIVIADSDALEAITSSPGVCGDASLWTHGADVEGLPGIDHAALQLSGDALGADERAPLTLADPALLIYTSGTTGLPKAARVSHFRIMMWSEWFAGVMDARPEDRTYDCLPLYHSVGGVVAVGAMLAAGGSVILRRTFSASRFWADIAQSRATIFQYIGELPRYLLASAADGEPPRHALRLCCGNGLRGDIWEEFRNRFAIPRIIEFYAATEGTFSLFNLEGRPGAIGRTPAFIAHRSPVALVKFDHANGRPLRDANGFCVRCDPDEAGEAIGRIEVEDPALATRFEGYTNEQENDRKILRDVFESGDAWFRTGDLMRRDSLGYFYFVDRIGDTFRWKGENVSTSEAEAVLCKIAGVVQAAVYGVAVSHADGRAGMAALVVDGRFDIAHFSRQALEHLPRFACPAFLRIRPEVAITGTFRPKKADLVRDGFDPGAIDDTLYVLTPGSGAYRPLDHAIHARILSGEERL